VHRSWGGRLADKGHSSYLNANFNTAWPLDGAGFLQSCLQKEKGPE